MEAALVDFAIRKATSDDHDAIINIRDDIYEGMDYVPALLEYLLKSNQGFVATVKNKIVSINRDTWTANSYFRFTYTLYNSQINILKIFTDSQ